MVHLLLFMNEPLWNDVAVFLTVANIHRRTRVTAGNVIMCAFGWGSFIKDCKTGTNTSYAVDACGFRDPLQEPFIYGNQLHTLRHKIEMPEKITFYR